MKKNIAIVFTVCVFSITGFAQNTRIDGLKQLAETAKNDTIRFNALYDLTFYYIWANPDSAFIYANKELLLANKVKSDIMRSRALSSKGLLASIMGNYSLALDYAINAKILGEKIGDKNVLYGNYTVLCLIYRDQGDFKNALYYAFKIPSISFNGNKYSLGHIGSVYEKFGHLDSALVYVNRAYEFDNKTDTKWTLLPNTMGNIYEKKGDYKLALQYYRQGISLAKNQNIVRDLVDMYNGMSNIFLKTGQNDSCIYYAKEIISISEKETIAKANAMNNIPITPPLSA
jgi:tetratricopeptide (TPR) repeat protein